MRSVFAITVIALCVAARSSCGPGSATGMRNGGTRLSDDEKHRLYSAALAASDSPLDNDTFKDVCQRIGIFDAAGKPNDQYMAFVSQHVNWGTRPEANQFRQEINSKDKAAEYIKRHLFAR